MVIFYLLLKLSYVYLGYHIDSLANEWNCTVKDNHPVYVDIIGRVAAQKWSQTP